MVFLFMIPPFRRCWGTFSSYDDRGPRPGFPKLNLLSWYVFMVGGLFTLYAVIAGGVDTGWTFYTPLSTTYSIPT